MYKLAVIDLDGTMLNRNGEVSEKTKEIVKKCMDKGIEIVLASGRTTYSIKTIAEEIGIKGYFIAGNGALVYDIQKNESIYQNYMKKEKVLEIIKLCEENSMTYNVYTDKIILTTNLKFNVLYYYKENLKKEETQKTNISIVENMYDYVQEMENSHFLKITICDENNAIFQSITKRLREIDGIDVLDAIRMSKKMIQQGTEKIPLEYFYTEVSAKNVDKWYAVEFLLKELNIPKEQVLAIGDNINDKKMIENAGMGIAMKSSIPEILHIAKDVTETNDYDGVAKVLEKYIL